MLLFLEVLSEAKVFLLLCALSPFVHSICELCTAQTQIAHSHPAHLLTEVKSSYFHCSEWINSIYCAKVLCKLVFSHKKKKHFHISFAVVCHLLAQNTFFCRMYLIHNNSRKTKFSKCKNIICIVAFVVSLHPNVVSRLE